MLMFFMALLSFPFYLPQIRHFKNFRSAPLSHTIQTILLFVHISTKSCSKQLKLRIVSCTFSSFADFFLQENLQILEF